MSTPRRIKTVDELRNTAYLYPARGTWRCVLDNGMNASFFYAVGNCDEAALRFALEDAESDEQRLNIVKAIAGPRRAVSFV